MAQYDLNLREYWRIIKKRRWIIILTLILTSFFSTFFALWNKPLPLYQSTASLKLERLMLSGGGIYTESMPWTNSDLLTAQAAQARSHGNVEAAARKLGLTPADMTSEQIRANKGHLATVLNLRNMIETDFDQQMGVINIHVKSEDPRMAMRLANALAEVYREERITEGNRRSVSQKGFIETQLTQAREKLKESEEAVKAYREKNKLVSYDAESASLFTKLQTAQASHDKARLNLQRASDVRRALERAESTPLGSKTSFHLEDAPAVYKTFNDKLVQLMFERDTLLKNYTELYPQVAEIRKQIQEVLGTMKSQLAAYESRLQEELRESAAQVSELSVQVKMLPEKRLELSRLERQVQLNSEVFTLLEKKNQEAMITNADRIETVQIIRPALEETKPINSPKTVETALLGILIGLILGITLAFVVETFDTSIGAIEEIEELLGVHVLGLIPHVSVQEIRDTLEESLDRDVDHEIALRDARLVSHFAPKSTMAEGYRSIRTNLDFVCLERDIKTVVMTSSSPQEGKTTSAVNLAITMAQAGRKILLVEGDLRKPVISKMFGLDQAPGLTDVLVGNHEWRKVVRSIADIMAGKMSVDEILQTPGIENLNILPAGTTPPNPAELLYSKGITELIKQARAEYDFVLIDAPPLLVATDAAILSSKVDGVVLVYRVGRIPRGALKRAKAQLDNVRAQVIGIILNGLKAELSPDYADHRYKTYYYYGHKEKVTFWDRVVSLPDQATLYVQWLANRRKNGRGGQGAPNGDAETQRKDIKALIPKLAARYRERRDAIRQREGTKKVSRIRTGIFLMAILFLLMGILYQAGYLKFIFSSFSFQPAQARSISLEQKQPDGMKSLDEGKGAPAIRAEEEKSTDRGNGDPA